MAFHHTKNKGDIGVACAAADLMKRGFLVLRPETEHAPFDLVIYKDRRFARVQVKYRELRNGVVPVRFTNFWADRHGVHRREMDKNEVDLVCAYCPDVDACFYIEPGRFGKRVCLRITAPMRNQRRRIVFADDHREVPWPCGVGVSAQGSLALVAQRP